MSSWFEGEGEFPISTIAQSDPVYSDSLTITSATFSCDETKEGTDIILYYLGVSTTVSGTYTFEEVSKGADHLFTSVGSWIKWKIRFVGYSGDSTYVENIKIAVND